MMSGTMNFSTTSRWSKTLKEGEGEEEEEMVEHELSLVLSSEEDENDIGNPSAMEVTLEEEDRDRSNKEEKTKEVRNKRQPFTEREIRAIHWGVAKYGDGTGAFRRIFEEWREDFAPSRHPNQIRQKWVKSLKGKGPGKYFHRDIVKAEREKKKKKREAKNIKTRKDRVEYTTGEIEAIFECASGGDGKDFYGFLRNNRHRFHPSRRAVNLYDKWRHDLRDYASFEEYQNLHK